MEQIKREHRRRRNTNKKRQSSVQKNIKSTKKCQNNIHCNTVLYSTYVRSSSLAAWVFRLGQSDQVEKYVHFVSKNS